MMINRGFINRFIRGCGGNWIIRIKLLQWYTLTVLS